MDLGLVGGLLILLFGLVLLAVALAPWIERLLNWRAWHMSKATERDMRPLVQRQRRELLSDIRGAKSYRDPQLDELLDRAEYSRTAELAAERLHLAIERGQEDLAKLYRYYLERIREHQPGS